MHSASAQRIRYCNIFNLALPDWHRQRLTAPARHCFGLLLLFVSAALRVINRRCHYYGRPTTSVACRDGLGSNTVGRIQRSIVECSCPTLFILFFVDKGPVGRVHPLLIYRCGIACPVSMRN